CRVADGLGIQLEKLATTVDVRWFVLRPSDRRGRSGPRVAVKHALVYAIGRRYRRMRSSMLQAIERGRPPAVDFLNGELTQRAARLGIEVPVNARARDLVWEIAKGQRASSFSTLHELYNDTQP